MAELTPTIIALPAIADLDALDGLRDDLVAAGEGGIRIEAGSVERVSTNTLLLLLAAARAAQTAAVPFGIAAPSPLFRLAIARLGLGALFAPLIEE